MSKRLATAKSQYLRSAAASPIDWHPWGKDAFALAKKDNKPILLDIGAVWCHWCHVMDHGTYEDDEVLRLLAEKFVCIKVDRDERPDVDARYQRAVGGLTGQGGWPLTAFLTPEGNVFFGGTYFPAEDAHGRPGLRSVLIQIAEVFEKDRERVEHSAKHIVEAVAERVKAPASAGTLGIDMLQPFADALLREHDSKFGGFGGAPKFPHPAAISLALTLHQRTGDAPLLRLAERTLDKMAAGGVHDQVAGGFHRYSVDAHWTVPHFEKMAYDNAELLRAYARAYAITGKPSYQAVAEGILRWIHDSADRERGGYAASQDADIGKDDDGDHFTWTLDELASALAPGATNLALDGKQLADIARIRFGVEARGDMHHDHARNVLELDTTQQETAEATGFPLDKVVAAEPVILDLLRKARANRPIPFIDPTRFTDWNAMTASACLEAGALMENPEATRQALRTIDRLVREAWDEEKGWLHRPRDDGGLPAPGLLDDQAWMGLALVDAQRFAGRDDLLALAEKTADGLLTHWRHGADAAFADTADWTRDTAVAAPLAVPSHPFLDHAYPGGNPVAARFLIRLGKATERADLVDAGRAALAAFAGEAPRMGVFAATWAEALEELVTDPPVVTVFGQEEDPAAAVLLAAARATPRAGLLVHHIRPGHPESAPSYLREVLANEDLVKDGPKALVCHGDRCDALLSDSDDLRMRILDYSSTRT